MKLTTDAIMAAAKILCQHLEESGHSEIELHQPLYWSIPKEQEHDASHEPTEHTLGDIEEDWAELSKILMDPSRAVGYGLVWLAAVLRAVGQTAAC